MWSSPGRVDSQLRAPFCCCCLFSGFSRGETRIVVASRGNTRRVRLQVVPLLLSLETSSRVTTGQQPGRRSTATKPTRSRAAKPSRPPFPTKPNRRQVSHVGFTCRLRFKPARYHNAKPARSARNGNPQAAVNQANGIGPFRKGSLPLCRGGRLDRLGIGCPFGFARNCSRSNVRISIL